MLYFLISIFMCLSLSASKSNDAKDAERKWVARPRVSFGTMDTMKVDIPRYKPDSIEHKILQLALDVENVFPYDTKYKETYLSNIPKKLHDNTEKRNANYMKIAAAKKAGSVFENTETGLLEASSKASPEELSSINNENLDRAELYTLMGSLLRLKTADKAKVSRIYAEAIKYQKYYVLSGEPDLTQEEDSGIFTSTASIYDSKLVWDELQNVIKAEEFLTIKNAKEKEGILEVGYKCNSDDATFMMRICTISNSKLSSCKNAPKDKSLYSYVDKGTLIWVEAGNLEPVIQKDKKSRKSKRSKKKLLSLIVPEYTTGEFQDTVYCKDDPRKFDIMEKLSAKLISVDPELKKDKSKDVNKK